MDELSPAMRDIVQALDAVRSKQTTPIGNLRINMFVTAGRAVLEPLVLEFLRRYPGVRIDLITASNLVDIA